MGGKKMWEKLVRKGLAIGIIVLFIGTSVIPSTGTVIEKSTLPTSQDKSFNTICSVSDCTQILEVVDSSEKLSSIGNIVYAYYGGGFHAWYPNGTYRFRKWEGDGWFSGGTWTNDGKWFCSMYDNGTLYEIDPETFDAYAIGDGGVFLNGLSYDPVTEKLYGASSDGVSVGGLYEINTETGEQTYIGDFGSDVYFMIAIAFDADGVLYGWDLGDKLWTIDTETGEATEVGPLGINLNYAQDGDFDMENDVLYLAAFTLSPGYGSFLYECDEDIGECTLVGSIGNGFEEVTSFAISYNWRSADFTWFPAHPDTGETILFDASESYDPDGYITLYEWDWNNDGIFDENHTSPTATHVFEEVGYYPVTLKITDNDNLTDRKTKTVRIENQPPYTPEIEGKRRFKVGEGGIHTYTIFSTDPDDDYVCYLINWTDGTQEQTGYYASGENITINVSIPLEKGTHILFKIKAIDSLGAESDWAILEITVSKSRTTTSLWYQWFLERFPILERLLLMFHV
jgi:hypothetical protein